ncbi:MAG: hypothetical protein V1836_03700 [Candidatus Aenigmatarchaeota archaeon]
MKRKGIALPIDMLVILAIAVIILIAVVAVFMGVWTPFAGNQQARANFNNACQILVNTGCADLSTSQWVSLCKAANGIVLSKATCDNDVDKLAVKVGCGCPNVAPLGATTTTATPTTTTTTI